VILLLRALARLVTFLLLLALAIVGLAVAVLGLSWLAELVGLPTLEKEAGRLLGAVEADGSVAVVSALSGLGAMVLGVLLLIGALTPRRERLVVLD